MVPKAQFHSRCSHHNRSFCPYAWVELNRLGRSRPCLWLFVFVPFYPKTKSPVLGPSPVKVTVPSASRISNGCQVLVQESSVARSSSSSRSSSRHRQQQSSFGVQLTLEIDRTSRSSTDLLSGTAYCILHTTSEVTIATKAQQWTRRQCVNSRQSIKRQ